MADISAVPVPLQLLNLNIKIDTAEALCHIGYGHFGGALSISETLAVLYGEVMRHRPEQPDWPERDRLVLSKGHAGPALYATLANCGYFPRNWLYTINDNGTRLPSHCDSRLTPGIDVTTGSLGQGLSCALGLALGAPKSRVFCIVGDGELQEGQNWEAIQYAAANNVSNLVVLVDHNKRQLDGTLEQIQRPFDLCQKLRAFGWDAQDVKGDDMARILDALDPLSATGAPRALVLDTIKGQGIPAVEAIEANHHLRLTPELRASLLADVQSLRETRDQLLSA